MKLTDAQYGALHTLREFGPKSAIEILLAPAMDGSIKAQLQCHFVSAPTLARLEADGLVHVSRSEAVAPIDCTGRKGRKRRKLFIDITDKGRAALQEEAA